MPLQGEGPFINGVENRPMDYGEVVRQSLDMSRPVDNRGARRSSQDAARTSGENKRTSGDAVRASMEGKAVRRMSQDVARVSTQRLRDVADELGQKAADDLKRQNDQQLAEQAKKGKGHDDHKEETGTVDFVQAPHDGLTSIQAAELLEKWGKNELPEKITPKWLIFCRLLIGPMPIVLWICALIEAIIENWADFVILLVIQFVNAGISFYETMKAGDAVAALKNSLKPTATCKRNGKWEDIDARMLVPGDLVLLAAGSAVPADAWVNEGVIEVDQSAMTGESLPVKFRRGDVCKLGSTVVRGETEGTVETTGAHTFFGKTAQMLQASGTAVSSLQILLLRIMIILVSLSLSLCVIALIYLIVEGRKANALRKESHRHPDHEIVKHSLSFAVCVLVASVPLAIEIVTTTTLAMGAKQLSGKGAIVTRLAAIEEMAGMDMLCSDKTGTLTLNKMVIQDDCPTYTPGETYESVLFQAALAAKWKEPPRDALDTMVLKTSGQDLRKCDVYEQLDFVPFDPRTKRTEGKLKGPDGNIFRITKGAPHVVMEMCHNKDELREKVEEKVHELGSRGVRSLALARMDNEDGIWKMLGILTFLDPPRPDTKHTIERCLHYGVRVKMITGDHLVIAKETARVLGMGSRIYPAQGLPVLGEDGAIPEGLVEQYGNKICPADGFASVFPEHKYLIVETLRQAGFRCGMTGDGVNDAPALKKADVGIAVQGATDAARAAADLVLTGEGLSTIIDGIEVARETFARLKNFISYRIAATLQLLLFFFIALFAFPPEQYYNKYGFQIQSGEFERQFINVPRKSPYCETGYDPSNLYLGYQDVDFNHPEKMWGRTGCNITLPICEKKWTKKDYDGTPWGKDKDGKDIEKEIQYCHPWPSFFQLPVLMLMLITLLTDGALISVGYDIVQPSPIPEQWNLVRLFIVASVMGGVSLGSSLLLLAAGLDSNNPNGMYAGLGLPPLEYGKVINSIFLKVSVSEFLTLFSCRTQEGFFWTVRPGKPLLGAVFISLLISSFLAAFWPEGTLDGLPVKGLALGACPLLPLWIWIFCLLWWFVQDLFKVLTLAFLNYFNLFPNYLADMKPFEEAAARLENVV